MDKTNKTLWVIDFSSGKTLSTDNKGVQSGNFYAPEPPKTLFHNSLPIFRSPLEDTQDEFLKRMDSFFKEILQISITPPIDKADAERKLIELTDSFEKLQIWVNQYQSEEDFQENQGEFFVDPDDLDGKDPS